MANDIYLRTHDGLAAMVSARVASRVLGSALKSKGLSADAVGPDQMRELLLGPVFEELEDTLPREGLRRNLKALAASIREGSTGTPSASAAPGGKVSGKPGSDGTVSDGAAPSKSRLASTLILDKDDEVAVHVLDKEGGAHESPIAPLLRQIEAELDKAERSSARGPAAAGPKASGTQGAMPGHRAPVRNLSAEALEEAVVHFASIDNVTLVAALRKDGSVASSRGNGVDLQALARYSHMGLALLQRRGPLRSYYLAHARGQLFLLPIGHDVLIVLGTPELNIGAVFTALAALKEEV